MSRLPQFYRERNYLCLLGRTIRQRDEERTLYEQLHRPLLKVRFSSRAYPFLVESANRRETAGRTTITFAPEQKCNYTVNGAARHETSAVGRARIAQLGATLLSSLLFLFLFRSRDCNVISFAPGLRSNSSRWTIRFDSIRVQRPRNASIPFRRISRVRQTPIDRRRFKGNREIIKSRYRWERM